MRLADIFLEQTGARNGVDAAGLERTLQAALEQGRSAWPTVHADAERFVCHLAGVAPDQATLEGVVAADLYLACACQAGDPQALATFDREVLAPAVAPVARSRGRAQFEQELKQAVRSRLFVAEEGGTGKIAQYAGTGPLLHWVRAVAARTALNLERSAGPVASEDAPDDLPVAEPDPELRALRAHYRQPFREAFRRAFSALPGERRTLLRLHFMEGLSHEQIGRLQQVHQSTISRRLAAAREQLQEEIRAQLAEQLRVPREELESLVRFVGSELEVSLSSLSR
jgi:RNA polymerase sigma-70 factor (ECF subfamily)